MEYLRAKKEDLRQIYQLVQDTIQAIYPQYYPHQIVDFFSKLHTEENIEADIENGFVRVLFLDHCLIGTGTLTDNHISRLFVLPKFQKNGVMEVILCNVLKKKYLRNTISYY